jgi:hypothetical protein
VAGDVAAAADLTVSPQRALRAVATRWRHHDGTVLLWRPFVWAIMGMTGWEALGLLAGGDAVFTAPGYDVLRALSPFGMRGYGPLLAALCIATIWGFDRYTRGLGGRWLQVSLGLCAGWYALWAVGTTAAWFVHWQILAWPGPARLALTSAVCMACARAIPRAGVRTAGRG